eukprot:6380384-Ditylum_brightwellii.AAC.1
MKYYMVMAKGISTAYYKYSNTNPIWGSSQGATDSPMKWGLNSNAIIKYHNKWEIGMKIQDPTRQVQTKRNNAMFVDDSTLFHNLMKKFNERRQQS